MITSGRRGQDSKHNDGADGEMIDAKETMSAPRSRMSVTEFSLLLLAPRLSLRDGCLLYAHAPSLSTTENFAQL